MDILASAPRAAGLGRVLLACLAALSSLFLIGAGGPVGAGAAAAQRRPVTGEWRVEFDRGRPDVVSLSMVLGDPFRGDGSRSDGPVALDELQGLTREQAFGSGQAVKFRVVREAGAFECEGRFSGGRGSGRWTLTVNEGFVAAMQSRGYALASDKELFEAALFGVSARGVDDLKTAGYDRVPFDKLVEARIFGVNPELIAEMRAAGYAGLTLDELVEARIFKVDRKFMDEVQALGFGRLPFRQLVELRSQGVTPEYARAMREAGFNLSARELVDFKVFGVTPAFVREVREAGYPLVTPSEIVELKVYKIDAALIRRARAKGPADLTLGRLVEMVTNGRLN